MYSFEMNRTLLNGLLQLSGAGGHRPGRIGIVDNTSSQTAPGEGALIPPGKRDGMVHSIPGRRQTTYGENQITETGRQTLLE